MGPTKFNDIIFNNDEKSLIQLAKFNDEYDVLREILDTNDSQKCILDRTSFGEYIWSRYWSRSGKYTDYVTSNAFINRHYDLLKDTTYFYFYMSDIDELERRISESSEDLEIFTIGGKTVKENIQYVYDLYEELNEIVRDAGIDVIYVDSSKFKTIGDDAVYIDNILTKF